MATYISGSTDYIPQVQPFAPDINLYANVLQSKQSKYDANWQSLNNVYSQYFYADLSREDNQQRRDELMKAIDFNLKKVSGLDLSLEQNVRQAKQLFTPFYEDKYLMRDIVYTKSYMQEMNKALSAKNCVGKNCEGTYWDGGVELLNYQLNKFKNVGLDESLNVSLPSYVPYFDLMKEANELVKKYNYEIVLDSSQGGYMVREKNGPNAVASLNDFILHNFMNNPRAADFYRAQAQLSYYKDPDKIYAKYQTLMNPAADPNQPADPKVKAQIQDEQNQNVLNETKLLFSTIANATEDEIKNLEYNKLLLEKRKEMFGSNWEATNEAKELENINTDLENKKRLQSDISPLNDQIQSVQYKDKDGKPLSEEQLVGTVAMGLLMGDALNTAQSIAMNKYSRTITGVDPYALAAYKAKMKALYSGSGSGSSGGSGGGKTENIKTDKIVTEVIKSADKYIKSDEGKIEIDNLKEQGYNERTAKAKIKKDQLENEIKKAEKENPNDEEIQERLSAEKDRLEAIIKNEQDKDALITNKANVTLRYNELISGKLEFDYVGKDGKTNTKKVGYEDVRNIYENKYNYIKSFVKQGIESHKNTYYGNMAKAVNNVFTGNNNIHQNKALSDYIINNNLQKNDDEDVSAFTSRIIKSTDFHKYLFEPVSKLTDESISINPKVVMQGLSKARFLLDQKATKDTDIGLVSRIGQAIQIANETKELAKVIVPGTQRFANIERLKQMGFSEKDIQNIMVDYVTLDKQTERLFKFNEQNKESLGLVGERWLKTNGYKKSKFPEVVNRMLVSLHPFEQVLSFGQGFGGSVLNTSAIQKYILYSNPYIQNNEGDIKINDRFNPVRSFVDLFIKDGKVDEDLKYLINATTPYNPKNPKEFRDDVWVEPKMTFSEKQIESLAKAGYWKGVPENGKILKFFNDIIPSKEVAKEVTLDLMKNLNSTGSRGNILINNNMGNDWGISAKTIAFESKPIKDISYLPKINGILDWVSKYIVSNDEALDSDFNRPGYGSNDQTFVPIYINNKPRSFEQTQTDLLAIKEIFQKDDLKKLFNINTEFQSYSEYSNKYSRVTFTLNGTSDYKTKASAKEVKKNFGYLEGVPITIHFPSQIDDDINKAKQQDFLSLTVPGSVYSSWDGYTTVSVKNIENDTLIMNVSDTYFENKQKQTINEIVRVPIFNIGNWNSVISDVLLSYSQKRNF